jgi:2-oxoglutarate ferredoxin oxidoreductase subunit alpha
VHPKGAYFIRGSGHTKYGTYTEDAAEYQEVVDRIKRKINGAADHLPEPEIKVQKGATVGVITVGSCRGAVLEGLDRLKKQGVTLDYMRIKAFPFGKKVHDFVASHEQCIVIEQNRDAQLRSLLILETGAHGDKLLSICNYAGLPLATNVVVDEVLGLLKGVTV